jgi:hypothetical protein
MRRHSFLALIGGTIVSAACAAQPPEVPSEEVGAQSAAAAQLACTPSPRMPVADRASPYDSTTFQVGATAAKICYGRPASAGRTMIGGASVPYDRLWRTGANEPTIIHLSGPATIAGVGVDAGSYSLYTIPTTGDWTIIVNRATEQWGHESSYTAEIEAQEVGRGTAPSRALDDHIERFTIRPEPRGNGALDLILEWERTRVTVPVTAGR